MLQADLFLPYPGTRVLVWGPEAYLVREFDGMLGLVDRIHHHIIRLEPTSYPTALSLLTPGEFTGIGIYRGALTHSVGFWLGRGAMLIAQFDEDIIPEDCWMDTTRIVVTPTTIKVRHHPQAPWEQVFWHLPPEPATTQ